MSSIVTPTIVIVPIVKEIAKMLNPKFATIRRARPSIRFESPRVTRTLDARLASTVFADIDLRMRKLKATPVAAKSGMTMRRLKKGLSPNPSNKITLTIPPRTRKSPWAIFSTRVTPKIRVNPTPTRERIPPKSIPESKIPIMAVVPRRTKPTNQALDGPSFLWLLNHSGKAALDIDRYQ